MRIGITDSAYARRYGARQYEVMRAHGYACADYQGMIDTDGPLFAKSPLAFARALWEERQRAAAAGVTIWQAHGPWRYPPRDTTEEARAGRLSAMKRSIAGAAILGARYWVIHPIMPFGVGADCRPEETRALNRAFFGELLSAAHAYGVTIALENMPFCDFCLSSPLQIRSFVEEMNDPALRICLDTGHAAVLGEQPADSVRTVAPYLAALHVHDNDGRGDRHDPPYTGWIDWDAFADALREVGFDGVLSLETEPKTTAQMPPEAAEHLDLALAASARSLADRAENQ